MTLNALTQAPDVYRMGIAVVAPVTHWKYYDTIYTEENLPATTTGASRAALP